VVHVLVYSCTNYNSLAFFVIQRREEAVMNYDASILKIFSSVLHYFCGVQQAADEPTALSARLDNSRFGDSSTTSPKPRASASHTTARSRSLADSPLGLWVVHRMKVVLDT